MSSPAKMRHKLCATVRQYKDYADIKRKRTHVINQHKIYFNKKINLTMLNMPTNGSHILSLACIHKTCITVDFRHIKNT